MKYTGGKYHTGKYIAEIMKELVPNNTVKGYLEPFCGALSVLIHMTDEYDCYASDIHPDLILLWKSVQNDTFVPPKHISEMDYLTIKNLKSPSALKAFVGFGCSFGGKYFGGYANKYLNGKKEDFLKEASNSIIKIKDKIRDVEFYNKSYDKWKPSGMLIYCDPPYQFTKYPVKYRTGTKHYDVFDNIKFWNVMRKWSKTNVVFVSETSAPDDFVSVWEKNKQRSASQSSKTRYKNKSDSFAVEKLYIHQSYLDA